MAELIVLGVIVSIVFYELTDITPGGIIVPGIMIMYISQPVKIVYTVAIACLACLLVKLFSRRFIVFGKRRFVLLILVCFLLHIACNALLGLFISTFSDVVFSLVGYTAAGVMANNIYRQGPVRTVGAFAAVMCLLWLLTLLLSALGVSL